MRIDLFFIPHQTDELALLKDQSLLTNKKVFYLANVAEKQLATADSDPFVAKLRAHAATEKALLQYIALARQQDAKPAADNMGVDNLPGATLPAVPKPISVDQPYPAASLYKLAVRLAFAER